MRAQAVLVSPRVRLRGHHYVLPQPPGHAVFILYGSPCSTQPVFDDHNVTGEGCKGSAYTLWPSMMFHGTSPMTTARLATHELHRRPLKNRPSCTPQAPYHTTSASVSQVLCRARALRRLGSTSHTHWAEKYSVRGGAPDEAAWRGREPGVHCRPLGRRLGQSARAQRQEVAVCREGCRTRLPHEAGNRSAV